MQGTFRFAAVLGFVVFAVLVACSGPEDANARAGRVLQIHPGQLQGALQRATGGDTLILHQGRYRGSFTITKRLRLIGAPGEARPVIDGRCRTNLTLAVRHDGVVLRRLVVVGADEGFGEFPSEVDFREVATGSARHLLVRDTCDAEYGINVFGSGAVDVSSNRGHGFSDSAIYVGGITDTGDSALRVNGNTVYGNNRGIIVEDSLGGRVRLVENIAHDNKTAGEGAPSGIFLHNSDGVFLRGNQTYRNKLYGIHLDPNSDQNHLTENASFGNPGGDFFDEGTGNCGARNHPDVFPPC
jgi:parallel beta-helix repeat protein